MATSFDFRESLVDAVGWIYVIAWGICLYPQVWLNFKRKSVGGLSLEFVLSNLAGYACYTIFNEYLVLDDKIKSLYINHYQLDHHPAQLNDLIFSAHGTFVTFIIAVQSILYKRSAYPMKTVVAFFCFCVFLILLWLKAFAIDHPIEWISFVDFMGSIKIVCTVLKYGPQAYLNHLRKSTKGYSIYSGILDFVGGTFSVLQLFLQGWMRGSFRVVFGNIPKLSLGILAVIFTGTFMIQHFVLYPENKEKVKKHNDATKL